MRKILLLVVLAALVAAPAHAAVQNIKVGGEIKSFHVLRSELDLGATSNTEALNTFATITKVNVAADLSDNVSAVISLINEREWGQVEADDGDSTIDLDLAYIELKEFLYSPLTVTIGRQHLQYGNSLIIGGPNDDSTGFGSELAFLGEKYGWDAIKLQLDYDPLTIDIFSAKVDENASAYDNVEDDVDLYGINLAYELGDDMATVVETYLFAKVDESVENNTQGSEAQNIYVPGIRVSTNPIEGLSFGAELAWQYGDVGGQTNSSANNLDAWALELTSSYALPMFEEYSPVLTVGYRHFSGDDSSTDSETNAWQTMYEDQDVGRIFDTIFALSNLDIVQVGLEATPMEDLTVGATWYGLWLDEKYAAAGNQSINGTTYAVTTDGELGHEFDLDIGYQYSEDVTLGLTAGVFFPGDAFNSAVNDETAHQVVSSIAVAF